MATPVQSANAGISSASPSTAFARATEVVKTIHVNLPQPLHNPTLAIICGSGLGNLQHSLLPQPHPRIEFPYASLPHFPQSSVEGHEGKMVFGFMRGGGGKNVPVVLLVGRAHFYEGHSMELVTFATRVLRVLDVQKIIVTNAAGGLNPSYSVGDIMLLSDHVNLAGLAGTHPLRGPNERDFGTRFPPLSDAYDLDLRRRAHRAWRDIHNTGTSTTPDIATPTKSLHEGVYAFVGGPSYETRAECRLLRLLGADVVGMSTVPEVITARHCGVKVLALSLVTNNAVLEPVPRGDDPLLQELDERELDEFLSRGRANHEEVLEEGARAAVVMQRLIERLVEGLMD